MPGVKEGFRVTIRLVLALIAIPIIGVFLMCGGCVALMGLSSSTGSSTIQHAEKLPHSTEAQKRSDEQELAHTPPSVPSKLPITDTAVSRSASVPPKATQEPKSSLSKPPRSSPGNLDPRILASVEEIVKKRDEAVAKFRRFKKEAQAAQLMSLTPAPVIAPPFRRGTWGALDDDSGFEIISVSGRDAVVRWSDDFYWFQEVGRNVTVGDHFKFPGRVVRIESTKEYTTVLGATNRVLLVEFFDIDPYVAAAERNIAADKPTPVVTETQQSDRSDEEKAFQLLKLAQTLLLKTQTEPAARKRLQEIVNKYPGTEAAAEAEKLLSK